MSEKCEFWFNQFYFKKRADLVISNAKAVAECMKKPAPVSFVMAAAITKSSEIDLEKINQMIINGPICGCRLIKNGKVSSNEL